MNEKSQTVSLNSYSLQELKISKERITILEKEVETEKNKLRSLKNSLEEVIKNKMKKSESKSEKKEDLSDDLVQDKIVELINFLSKEKSENYNSEKIAQRSKMIDYLILYHEKRMKGQDVSSMKTQISNWYDSFCR